MTTEPDGATTYAYRPSVVGAAWSFGLTPEAITLDAGRRSGRIAFRAITRVRLSYRPTTMQRHRYCAELWSKGAPRLEIASISCKGMFEQERLDLPYTRFVEELHRRIVATGAPVRFDCGINPLVYWFGVALFAVTAMGLAGMTVRAVEASAWLAAAMVGVFLGVFLWHAGNYFRRNWPIAYDPRALPVELLPPRKA